MANSAAAIRMNSFFEELPKGQCNLRADTVYTEFPSPLLIVTYHMTTGVATGCLGNIPCSVGICMMHLTALSEGLFAELL